MFFTSMVKLLQINTYMLLTITSACDKLLGGINIDDVTTLNPQNRGFGEF